MANRYIPNFDGLPAKAALDLRNFIQEFFALNDQVQSHSSQIASHATKIAAAPAQPQPQPFLGPVAANVTPFLNPQIAKAVSVTTLPDVNNDTLSQDGTLISFNGVIYRFDGVSTNPGAWKELGAAAVVIRDTHANRVNYPPANYPAGTLYFETNRTVFYVNSGSNWVYATGRYVDTLANRPADLGANDVGFQFFASNTSEYFRWDGAAWQDGDLLISGNYKWLSGTTFKGTLDHANSADRAYAFADADGNIVYETAALTSGNFLLGGGGARAADSGFASVPVDHGGTGADNTNQTYVPAITSVLNVDASTAYTCQFFRVGNVITVSGRIDIDATAAGAATKLLIQLPVASAFAATEQCGGTASDPNNSSANAAIFADASGDALMSFVSATDVNEAWFFSFTYLVV